jgi:hypothetical protein
MSKQEWLEVMMPHITGDLKRQVGFSLATGRGPQGSGSMTMVQFSPDYQLNKGLRINSYELGRRAYEALEDEPDWSKGRHIKVA